MLSFCKMFGLKYRDFMCFNVPGVKSVLFSYAKKTKPVTLFLLEHSVKMRVSPGNSWIDVERIHSQERSDIFELFLKQNDLMFRYSISLQVYIMLLGLFEDLVASNWPWYTCQYLEFWTKYKLKWNTQISLKGCWKILLFFTMFMKRPIRSRRKWQISEIVERQRDLFYNRNYSVVIFDSWKLSEILVNLRGHTVFL